MRDRIMQKEYFDNYVERQTKRVLTYCEDIKNGEVREDRIQAVKTLINNIEINVLVAKYSRGDDVDDIKKMYEEIFPKWLQVFEPNYYNKNLRMLSLGICLKTEVENILKIYEMLRKNKKEDWLYEFLVKSYIGGKCNNDVNLLFKKNYGKLKEIVTESLGPLELKNYLQKNWYNSSTENYNAHNRSNNSYYGYWSFEVGAIAKILKIDDSELKDMKYYPYDLVHYKEEKDGITR